MKINSYCSIFNARKKTAADLMFTFLLAVIFSSEKNFSIWNYVFACLFCFLC